MKKAIERRVSNSSAAISGSPRALRWLVVAAILLGPAAAAAENKLEAVRVGKHEDKTRVVFQLSGATGYQVQHNNPAPGISEIMVSFEASGQVPTPAVPSGSLIERLDLQTDGERSVAHIRLVADGLHHKEMTLREPPRIVIDIVDERAAAANRTARTAPKVVKPAPAAEPTEVAKSVPAKEPTEVVAPVPSEESAKVMETAAAEEPAEVAPVEEPAVVVVSTPAEESAEVVEEVVEEVEIEAVVDRTAALPSDPTAPLEGTEPVVPIASNPQTSLPPNTSVPAEAESGAGWFTMRNLALAAAGVAVVIFASFILGRRAEEEGEFTLDDEEELSGDNPFSGLESAAESPVVVAEETAPEQDDAGRNPLFDEPPAVPVDEEPVEAHEEPVFALASEDVADDAEHDEEAVVPPLPDPEIHVPVQPVVPAPAAAADEAGGQLVRELTTRVGELETRLEDAVDAKDRLERQLAAQTEELRVQRAAIARTQRAVRNLTQAAEDKPTEPTPRVGG